MADPNASKLSSIKTYLLIAFVFNLLVVLGYLVAFLLLAIVIIGFVFLVPLILSFLTFRRINGMRNAANRGDIAKLKGLNSVGWSILTLLFAGVIPGVMLLIANGPINELSTLPSMSTPSGTMASPAASGTRFCPSCGASVTTDAAICPKCGAKLS